jgi:AcrR family transcriptional regulator
LHRQQASERKAPGGQTKRQERTDRILDAAATLIQRWSYNKTSIDDIARQAGVAKGTIYLHWKSREELFRALILREQAAVVREIQQRVAQDPEGGTLHGMIKYWGLVVMQRPLLKALFLRDTTMLGELARSEYSGADYQQQLASFKAYMEFLRAKGLVRSDISLDDQLYMLSAITTGFCMIDPFLPDDFRVPIERAAALMAESVRRVFEPVDGASPEDLQEASAALTHFLVNVQVPQHDEGDH